MNGSSAKPEHSGLTAALGAYLLWGLLPLYLVLVREVPAFEFVAWRIVWTLPFCLLIVLARGQWPMVRQAFTGLRTFGWLIISASLIGANWLIYIWAIQSGYIFAASLGYYINPLVNVLLGTLILKERLSGLQWLAVALAGVGVAILSSGALATLWISLGLAATFGFYGLVRKQIEVGAVPGLTVESALLVLPSAAIIWVYATGPAGTAFGTDAALTFYIVLAGVVTAVPLLLFAIAARRMPYSTLGFIQFLAPSIVFILGLTVYDEQLQTVEAVCFGFIWTAAAIFIVDLLRGSRPAKT